MLHVIEKETQGGVFSFNPKPKVDFFFFTLHFNTPFPFITQLDKEKENSDVNNNLEWEF